MKRKTYTVFKCIVFLILLSIVLLVSFQLTERKESQDSWNEFFDNADKVDVLFCGSSHVVNSIDPTVLWDDYGISSYNIAGHGSILPVTYWSLVNALDYCTPQYVFVDVFMLERDYQYVDQLTPDYTDEDRESAVSQLHNVVDAIPFSKNKINMIQNLVKDWETREEFYFRFLIYHSRWSELTQADHDELNKNVNESDYVLGSEMRYETCKDVYHFDLIPQDEMNETETVGKEYLRKIIELCQSRGIEVILFSTPFAESPDYQSYANSAQKIADEYDVRFMNLNYVNGLFDCDTDSADQTHLNAHGAYVVSEWIGGEIAKMGYEDHRGQEGYEFYDEAAAKQKAQLKTAVVAPKDIYSLLTSLEMNEFSCILFINNNSNLFHDEEAIHEIERITGTEEIEKCDGSGQPYLLIHDSKGCTDTESTFGDYLYNIKTEFGTYSFFAPDPKYNLLIEGEDTTNLLDYEYHSDADVQVLIFDSETGEMLTRLFFTDEGPLQSE